jgi:PAS domain S-box-containing protein
MNRPTRELAVLIVEDTESDAQLIVRLLKKAGYELAYEQVETDGQMRAALKKRFWDIVISDFKMPQFDGRAALKLLQDTGRDIPFIVVSGTIGEEIAVSMMKAGAHDYLIKGELARLVPAVERELGQARMRQESRQAQKALADSEIKFRWLYEFAPMAYHLLTPDGTITDVNLKWCDLLGYNKEEAIGRLIFDFVVEEERDEAKTSFERKKQNQQPFIEGSERNFLTKDGAIRIFKTYDFFVRDQEHNVTSVQTTIEDITERRLAEDALKLRESYLTAIIENQPGLVWLKDLNGRFLAVNGAFALSCGKEISEEVLGKTDLDIWPKDLAEKYRADDAEVIVQKTSLHVEEPIFDQGKTKWFETFKKPIFNEMGQMIGTTGFARDITDRKQAEEGTHRHVAELEMLYQSGLALSQLLNPKEIGQKILELLDEKLGWQNTRIRLYHPQDDSLELLDFKQPGLKNETERHAAVERAYSLITRSDQGMNGWVVQHGQPLRSGNVSNDPHYIEAYPGIHSGLYVPIKLGERKIGVISIESEEPDAFSEADERLIATLANQAASAFENARLFEEAHQRVMELETINRISLALRGVSEQDEMLSIVLDEALVVLNTPNGSIELYDKSRETLQKTITRGWTGQVIEPPQNIFEGIAGKVLVSGEAYISHEFSSDPETRAISRSLIPPNWGGIFLPIRTAQQTLGVMSVCVPSERKLDQDEIRLLVTLSEMTGAALQRMQLHEQTVRRLDQLRALRAVDQAISSSRNIHLTLDILLTHTISRLNVDAADVLLFQPGSNMLELVAGRGFHTLLLEDVSLSDSIAGRAIMEHRSVMALDFETATVRENPQIRKLWKEEGFACYWCVPLSVKGETKGVLEVYRRTTFTPESEWVEFLEALAGQAAIAIDSTQLFENLQRANLDLNLAYDATIEGWSRAMDLRDHETEGHTLRVTDLTVKLARAMHISESQLTAIRRGALLHDIGKMGVPDSILLKEGELTEKEWAVMRQHPEFARDMLSPIAYLHDALVIPYCHHERWDGTGYPQRLKGINIPLAARIFAVVDVWDALTNNRTYRKKWTKSKVRQHIKEQSGKHFDPQIVDVFLKYTDRS